MRKAQILLRDDQTAALQQVSYRTGRTRSELIRHGVDLALAETDIVGREASHCDNASWKTAWLNAAGLWSGRTDLGDLDRGLSGGERQDRLDKQWRDDAPAGR